MENQQLNPVGWFEIYVNDMDRARKFYENVLQIGLEPLPMPEEAMQNLQMMAFPFDETVAGASGALVKTDGFPGGGGATIVYFSCDDCANEESRVESAGGKIEKSKMSIGEYGFITLAVDTEGNMIGFHSLK